MYKMIFEIKRVKHEALNFLVILFLVLLSCSRDDSINCVSFLFPDAYEYPVKPGTQEWIDLESRDARVNVCMIPQEIFKTISTGGLLESLLSYPYNREDLFEIIYSWYGSLSLNCEEWIYHPFNAPLTVELQIIEILIFQDEFLNSLSQDEVTEVFKLIFNKLKLKIEHGYYEGEKSISAAILGKIMFRSEFSPFVKNATKTIFLNSLLNLSRHIDLWNFLQQKLSKIMRNTFTTTFLN